MERIKLNIRVEKDGEWYYFRLTTNNKLIGYVHPDTINGGWVGQGKRHAKGGMDFPDAFEFAGDDIMDFFFDLGIDVNFVQS